jgi:hypothetical protein
MTQHPNLTERERLSRLRKQASRDLRAIVAKREQEQAERDRALLDGVATILNEADQEQPNG